ncbi:MAG: arginine--tRNA ligase domain-containing protein, partial [Candidatus Aminicenantia bacterium]
PYVERIEEKGGFLNFFLKKKEIIKKEFFEERILNRKPLFKKIIVEHTNINPNKSAHIGHLRNACLGDTLVRCLKFLGENVEVQNYIDDTGIQVADVVYGFLELEGKRVEDVDNIVDIGNYFWDLYTKVGKVLEKSDEEVQKRNEIHKKIEEGEGEEAVLAREISRKILLCHLKTMNRIGIRYDLLPHESHILKLKFWETAFELLKSKNAIYFSQDGKNKGCWVMPYEGEEREKVIVRSTGTLTYLGKDIAYQLWKFGLLGKDFYYSEFPFYKDKELWITSDIPSDSDTPEFGKGERVYNVIDVRQSDLQRLLSRALRILGWEKESENSIHFSYEMVSLSHNSAREMGFEIPEEDLKKPFVEVSGRKGIGVKADELLDKLEEKAFLEIEKRSPELDEEVKRKIARDIATGALRYFMIKYGRNSILVFDFSEALDFEGESGPYIQYSAVRTKSIFKKLEELGIKLKEEDLEGVSIEELNDEEIKALWDIIIYGSFLQDVVESAVSSLEFSHIAKYFFNIARKFNLWYHKYPVIQEKERNKKILRILFLNWVRKILNTGMDLMGIPEPERM